MFITSILTYILYLTRVSHLEVRIVFQNTIQLQKRNIVVVMQVAQDKWLKKKILKCAQP